MPSSHGPAHLNDLARQKAEISAFRNLWAGGYFEGDPLDPMAASGYGAYGYMSCLHATYLVCIKPYVTEDTRVLEIGPGRGAWTKCFLARDAKEVWALDALPETHNRLFDYVGLTDRVKYFQVADNSCSMVPDDSIDFFFSFGCFCHLSPESVREYMTSVFSKLRKGARGFFMFADYDKYNSLSTRTPGVSLVRAFSRRRLLPFRFLFKLTSIVGPAHPFHDKAEETAPRPGRWYHLGTENAVAMMERIGFRVIDADVGVIHRDPVLHFSKP